MRSLDSETLNSLATAARVRSLDGFESDVEVIFASTSGFRFTGFRSLTASLASFGLLGPSQSRPALHDASDNDCARVVGQVSAAFCC